MSSYEILPVKTRILTHNDDIVKAIKEYCQAHVEAGDVIAVAESVVAITQKRAFDIQEITPGLLAKILCRFFPVHGSLANRYAMQALMNEEGELRVLGAFLAGSLARVMSPPGVGSLAFSDGASVRFLDCSTRCFGRRTFRPSLVRAQTHGVCAVSTAMRVAS